MDRYWGWGTEIKSADNWLFLKMRPKQIEQKQKNQRHKGKREKTTFSIEEKFIYV